MIKYLVIFFLLITTNSFSAWTVDYDCSVVPTSADPSWAESKTGDVTSDGDILTIACDATEYGQYNHNAAGKPWKDNVSNATGWNYKIRLKVVSWTSPGVITVISYDGTRSCSLALTTTTATLVAVGGNIVKTFDTTDDFHIYRVTGIGTAVEFFVDDVSEGSSTMDTTGEEYFIFGDNDTGATNSLWDYVKYYTGGTDDQDPPAPPVVVAVAAIVSYPLLKSGDCVGHQMINQGMVN